VIRLEVPGDLRFRGVVVRAVAAACRLARNDQAAADDVAGMISADLDLSDSFDAEMVSAVSEAFNNIVIHAYAGREPGRITVEIELAHGRVVARLFDTGASLEDTSAQPDLDSLPEGGLGLFIIQSFVDKFDYTPGTPNVWSMVKSLSAG
jgi:serine/threonine-protein kinase RsbW